MDVGLVCDACSALTPIGVPQCARCGADVALDPRARGGSRPPPSVTATAARALPCPKCTFVVAPGLKFCPSCGHRMPLPGVDEFEGETRVGPVGGQASKVGRATMMFNQVMQAARAKLTLIRGDGEDGVSFTLAGSEHLAGRGECPIAFPDDPFLSPIHANFLYRDLPGGDRALVVRDEGSLNGVFVRITDPVTRTLGATPQAILIGEQLLLVTIARQHEDVPDDDGTYFSASMVRPSTIEIRQQLRGGATAWTFRQAGELTAIGREGNDINFPDDPFISGHHAELRFTAPAMLSVTDLGSRNGTFVRIEREHVLKHGDYVFLGQQLLRVEIV